MVKIGVIGGGQLARMMIPAAINLGVDIAIFSESTTSSAKLAATRIGDYTKLDELVAFAAGVDVVTFDHEHVPLDLLVSLEERGITVAPSPPALALVQNKLVMRRALATLEVPQPRWCEVASEAEFPSAFEAVGGLPCIAKLPIGGYDGKGVRVVETPADLAEWIAQGPLLLEEKVEFRRELSQVGARNAGGEWVAWPTVETRQSQGVCSEVIAPARNLSSELLAEAEALARKIADEINVVGVLAVELFEDADGQLLVNELAMRPHNSGHVFTELSVTSQFEQHLRAVSNMPLGSPTLVAEEGIMVNIFGGVDEDFATQARSLYPRAKIHSYQKEPRGGRKAGHVVIVGSDGEGQLEEGLAVRSILNQREYDE